MLQQTRPVPQPNALTQPYWDGARRHQLMIQRCRDCRTYQHPPLAVCRSCQSFDLDFSEVSGRGTVYSWSVMHSRGNPGFDDRLPFAVVIIELEEQPGVRLVGNFMGDRRELKVGLPVEVTWEELSDEIHLPQWQMIGGLDAGGGE